jgi:hypothetical protein
VPFFVPEILPQTKILKYKNNENYLKYNLILEKIPYINKNIFLQKKNNYNLKISRFFFNNQLIVFNKLKYQTINNFENHRSQRIHRRF